MFSEFSEEGNNINPSPLRRRDQIVRWFSQEWGSTLSVCESVRAKMKTCKTVMEPQSKASFILLFLFVCFPIIFNIFYFTFFFTTKHVSFRFIDYYYY